MTARGDQIFPAVVMGHLPAALQIIFLVALISALFPSADGAITVGTTDGHTHDIANTGDATMADDLAKSLSADLAKARGLLATAIKLPADQLAFAKRLDGVDRGQREAGAGSASVREALDHVVRLLTQTPKAKDEIIVEIEAEKAELAGEIFGHIAAGRIQIEINQRYALQDAVQAHRDLEARKTIGSSIFVI